MKTRHFAALLLAGASTLAFASAADAQSAPASDVSEVVVTGSRVITNGNNSPTPLTVVSAQQLLESQPTTVAAALQALPVFAGSLGQNTGTGGGAAGPNGTANAPNIRNLGLFRNLTLMDGHRVQATSDTGVVTIDLIPQMLLQRVDVVTGGASAVYGSDAISGVVNFVTDNNFNGLKFKAQRGISELGDDPATDIGVAFGTKLFDGRGHFEGSLEFTHDEGIFDMFRRPAGQRYALEGSVPGSTAAVGTAANPYRLYSDVRVATTSFGGQIRSGPLAGQNFTTNGVLQPFVHGALTGSTGFEIGGDGGYYFNTTMKGALRAHRAFGRFDYDFTDKVHFYAEALGASNTDTFQNQSLGYNNYQVGNQDAFLPASVRAQLPTTGSFTFAKIPMQLGPHRSNFRLTDYQISTGLSGEIGSGWKWDVDASHGYAQQNWKTLRNVNFQKLYAALDAVTNPANGQIVCSVTLTNPGLYPGCVPLNPFGPTSESAEALAYITDYTQSWAVTYLDEISGSISGAPVSTWAGPVNVALSGEWRKTSISSTSEVPPTDLQNCTGLRFNCSATSAIHAVTFRNAGEVSQSVKEVAVEADVPLLKAAPFAESLNVNLAARYASYDSSGGATFNAVTWKVGLDWHVNDEIRLRATRSRDFRAPNANDLFAPLTISRGNVVDQLTGATLIAVPTSGGGGNLDLKPEVADTLTAGIIYRPGWLPGASLSVDAYDIQIDNAISGINGGNVTVQRLCNASGGTSPYCALIVRPLGYTNTTIANNATLFRNVSINAAFIKSHGADIEANYNTTLFDHPLSARLLTTWQPELRTVIPGISDLDSSGAATPEWRVTGFLNYNVTDDLRVTLTERWRSAVWWNSDRTLVYDMSKVPAFYWTNMNITWSPKWETKTEFYLNIQNLFDQQAPFYTTSTANPGVIGAYFPSDDYVGRYYTVGVRVTL